MADENANDPNDTQDDGGSNGNNDDSKSDDAGDDLETWKAHARKWERTAKENKAAAQRAADAEKRLTEYENASKSEQEKEIDRVRTEATEAARKDALTAANQRIVKSEVRAVAAGKLADPEDAVRFLDLDDVTVSDDGDVDTKALTQAVDRLLKDKPYLAVDTRRKHGDGDQGARGRNANGTSMNDLIREKAGRR